MAKRQPNPTKPSRVLPRDARGRFISSRSSRLPTPPLSTRLKDDEDILASFPVQYPTSSRCQAFRFVPYSESPSIGTLYMRFVKGGTPWVYRNVPVGIYEAFASAPSKGRAVNTLLNPFSSGNPTHDEVAEFFDDM